MTVRDWVTQRTPQPPAALAERIMTALGGDADLPATRTAEACLAAATRTLDAILSENQFGRDGALVLLTVDALTAYAFEHASQLGNAQALESLAERGAHRLGQLMTQRV